MPNHRPDRPGADRLREGVGIAPYNSGPWKTSSFSITAIAVRCVRWPSALPAASNPCPVATAHCIIYGGGNQILKHFLVIHDGGVNGNAANIMRARHHHLDHAGPGLALHFDLRQLFLGFLHVFLHLLRLFHQAANSTFQHRIFLIVVKGV